MNGSNSLLLPVIPENITVHLGRPSAAARNVTVPFSDYIKNVASSEIYPTWPEEAIRANVYAQISFALNRIYTEYYRSRGYDYDITNSTTIDQSYVYGRDIFENVSRIVDEIFNSYIRREGNVEPLFAAYCDGIEVQCAGLSQWGTVSLANNGMSAIEILRYYFGDDIELVTDVPVMGVTESYPGIPLRLGSVGNDVRFIQLRLNRISRNYPGIPKISDVNGIFDSETEAAVRAFQRQFSLDPDGIVGSGTWYAIERIYNAVKRISDLNSEGVLPEDVTLTLQTELSEGMTGPYVSELQYVLSLISAFNSSVRAPAIDGIFGAETRAAVEDFQYDYGLPVTGMVNGSTWQALYSTYRNLLRSLPEDYFSVETGRYPGTPLVTGSRGEAVRELQLYLNRISDVYTEIPKLTVDGVFGAGTAAAVREYQRIFGIPVTGVVGAATWYSIADTYRTIAVGSERSGTQFGGVIG